MTHRQPRNDTFATFDGREYRATEVAADGTVRLFHDSAEPPPDPRFAKHPHGDVWVLKVPATDLDRLVMVSTEARWRGAAVQVDRIAEDGTADLYYLRDTHGVLGPPAGFAQVGQHEFRTKAPASDLHDYHESHRDLLHVHGARR